MKSLFIFIGSLVITAILLAIPVLTALSFVFNWNNFIKFILIMLVSSEFILVTTYFWVFAKNIEE